MQATCLCDQFSSQLAGRLCDWNNLPVRCGECLSLEHSPGTLSSSWPWEQEEKQQEMTMPCQFRVALAPALPSPLLQLKGPDLPKMLIQTEVFVKGQNAKNSLPNSKYFGTQIQKLCQESDKRRDMLILLSFSLCSSLQERLEHFCFLIFMGVLFTSGIIIHLFLPETKGKSIVEITEEFNKLNFKKKHITTTPNLATEDCTFCTRL